ncbi:MAG: c-type cytochrome [Candidatus Dactylopiibacterium sp.]|nr:c-type cytochrome [Candidatus Dactylopiibacterium sp.]
MSGARLAVCAVLAVLARAALAAPDGAALFQTQCADCHTVEPGRNKRGPSLAGVVGRRAAALPAYNYSDALRGAGVVWTPERLARYLASPRTDIPGGKMRLLSPPRAEEIHQIIDWLRQQP